MVNFETFNQIYDIFIIIFLKTAPTWLKMLKNFVEMCG